VYRRHVEALLGKPDGAGAATATQFDGAARPDLLRGHNTSEFAGGLAGIPRRISHAVALVPACEVGHVQHLSQPAACFRTVCSRPAVTRSSPSCSMKTEIKTPLSPVPRTRPIAIGGSPAASSFVNCSRVSFTRPSSQVSSRCGTWLAMGGTI